MIRGTQLSQRATVWIQVFVICHELSLKTIIKYHTNALKQSWDEVSVVVLGTGQPLLGTFAAKVVYFFS